jgi:FtsP/CotA-like multicopper oxidase with cupredoxin domain
MRDSMNRRDFLAIAGAGIASAALGSRMAWAQPQPDYRLEIAPFKLELAPGKTIDTVAYNGQVPGPLIRWPEDKPIRIAVTNRTDVPEIVHWHGLFTPSDMDGAMEEGTPLIAPGATFTYAFTPRPSGFRWYHTHTFAGHDLKRGQYGGQFGCFYLESRNDPGAYDQEIFLTLHDWNAYMGGGGDASMDVFYDYATINDRMLGHADPIRVRTGQRLLVHLLNASATVTHWIALSGHAMQIVAMDGNPLPRAGKMPAVRIAPAERLDLLIEMNRPGVWILGETRDEIRSTGMGIVLEYAGASGSPQWVEPPETEWDYLPFANPTSEIREPDVPVPLLFESKFKGHGEFDYWTINGKSFPHTDAVPLQTGKRYRLVMKNHSMDDHPIHLHRHTFEVTSLEGRPLSGLHKDVVVVKANSTATVDFDADNPGATLFHCHQQSHMDLGFMMLFDYRA